MTPKGFSKLFVELGEMMFIFGHWSLTRFGVDLCTFFFLNFVQKEITLIVNYLNLENWKLSRHGRTFYLGESLPYGESFTEYG